MNDQPLPRSIDEYLKQLRRALAGADKALIQDALYDAEEYLRNEMRDNPDKSEADLLAGIAASYGAPEEVADAYRQTEVTVQQALRTPRRHRRRQPSPIARFFGVMADPRSYTSVLFLLLGLPMGVFLFSWAVAGLSLSIGLSMMIFGIPFFLLFLASVRLFSLVEGRIVEALLGVRMPRRPLHPGPARSWWRRILDMLSDGRTWSTILYMLLKLPFGIASFVFAVVGLSCAFSLIFSPVVEGGYREHIFWNGLALAPPAWAQPLVVVGGVALLVVLMHAFRWAGTVQGHLARALLVKSSDSDREGAEHDPAPADD